MILVLDDEVQVDYRYLGPEIARFLGDAERQVYLEEPTDPNLTDVGGVVISGSTASVYDEDHSEWIERQERLVRRAIDRHVPILGICFGHQLVNRALEGTVEPDRRRATFVEMDVLDTEDAVLSGVAPVVPVLHRDVVVDSGDGLVPTASTEYNDYFCTRHESAPCWTVQFHPEFTEHVVDRPTDWNPGAFSFVECNATRVLENFRAVCAGR